MGFRKQIVSAAACFTLAVAAAAQTPGPSARPFHLSEATIDDIHAALRSQAITCRRLVQGYLNRISTYDNAGARLNSIQTINPRALEEADRLDAALRGRVD